MRTKTGNRLHLKGNPLPILSGTPPDKSSYALALASALHTEIDVFGQSIKTIMRWTGASERAVKYWISGRSGPTGVHLIALIMNSDVVMGVVMDMAGRDGYAQQKPLRVACNLLHRAVIALEQLSAGDTI